jgi:hypothetical protein
VPPGATDAEVEEPLAAPRLKSPPVPDNATVCGLPAALSVKLRVPVRVPAAEGLKVTLTVQLALTARLAPQLELAEKSPLAAMLLTLRVAWPVFLSVTLWALLLEPTDSDENVSEVGERLAVGAEVEDTPVPVRLTV